MCLVFALTPSIIVLIPIYTFTFVQYKRLNFVYTHFSSISTTNTGSRLDSPSTLTEESLYSDWDLNRVSIALVC